MFHNQFKTLSCAWVPVMSVRLCSSISLSVRLYVRHCPSICHQSVSVSPCSSRSLSRTLVDAVVHWNLSYNFLPLLSHSSILCVRVCDCFWVSMYRRTDGTFSQATWRCRYKQRIPYCMVTSHYAQTARPTGGPANRDFPV